MIAWYGKSRALPSAWLDYWRCLNKYVNIYGVWYDDGYRLCADPTLTLIIGGIVVLSTHSLPSCKLLKWEKLWDNERGILAYKQWAPTWRAAVPTFIMNIMVLIVHIDSIILWGTGKLKVIYRNFFLKVSNGLKTPQVAKFLLLVKVRRQCWKTVIVSRLYAYCSRKCISYKPRSSETLGQGKAFSVSKYKGQLCKFNFSCFSPHIW